MQRNSITSASGTTINYTAISGDNAVNNNGFFIENDSLTLDTQNEWWYSPSRKKLRIYSISSPTNVQMSTLDTLVYMPIKSNFIFNGISFTGSNKHCFFLGSTDSVTIKNCTFQYHLDLIWGGNNFGGTSYNLHFDSNTVSDIHSKMLYMQTEFKNPHIWANTIKRVGIYYGMFEREDTRYDFSFPFGVISSGFDVDGYDVAYNSIDSTGYNGIEFNDSHSHSIHNNNISHYCLLLMDGGGIYGFSGKKDSLGSKVYNNIVHDGIGDNSGTSDAGHLASGIYFDAGFGTSGFGEPGNTNQIESYGNVCFNNALAGIYCNSNQSDYLHNNLLYNNTEEQFLSTHVAGDTARHNVFTHNQLIAVDSLSKCASFNSYNSTVDWFDRCDSNYYAKPMIDNSGYPYDKIGWATNSFSTFGHDNLSDWQAAYGYDVHSFNSAKAITSSNSIRIDYNATNSSANTNIPWYGETVDGLFYNGLVALGAYSGVVTLKNGAILSTNVIKLIGNIKIR
jgi:hypothetical protein